MAPAGNALQAEHPSPSCCVLAAADHSCLLLPRPPLAEQALPIRKVMHPSSSEQPAGKESLLT